MWRADLACDLRPPACPLQLARALVWSAALTLFHNRAEQGAGSLAEEARRRQRSRDRTQSLPTERPKAELLPSLLSSRVLAACPVLSFSWTRRERGTSPHGARVLVERTDSTRDTAAFERDWCRGADQICGRGRHQRPRSIRGCLRGPPTHTSKCGSL